MDTDRTKRRKEQIEAATILIRSSERAERGGIYPENERTNEQVECFMAASRKSKCQILKNSHQSDPNLEATKKTTDDGDALSVQNIKCVKMDCVRYT